MRKRTKFECVECGERYDPHEVRKGFIERVEKDRLLLPGTKTVSKHKLDVEPCDCGSTAFYPVVTLE